MTDNFIIRVWGPRGSIPAPGPKTVKYGGNTSCLELRCGKELIILDGGTGLRELGFSLLKELPVTASILFSHFHWDHIQGFPFFTPGFIPGNKFTLYGENKSNVDFEKVILNQMSYPNFPISLKDMGAEFNFIEVNEKEIFHIGKVKVDAVRTNHPDGCIGYRIEYNDKVIMYATDTEHFDEIDQNLVEGAQNVDYLIYDTAYTDEEYSGKVGMPRKGWGHSTWNEAVKLAKVSNAKNLILWHHDHTHDDSMVENIKKQAQKEFPNTIAAYEGLEIKL